MGKVKVDDGLWRNMEARKGKTASMQVAMELIDGVQKVEESTRTHRMLPSVSISREDVEIVRERKRARSYGIDGEEEEPGVTGHMRRPDSFSVFVDVDIEDQQCWQPDTSREHQ
jgi:hypothetical protein